MHASTCGADVLSFGEDREFAQQAIVALRGVEQGQLDLCAEER